LARENQKINQKNHDSVTRNITSIDKTYMERFENTRRLFWYKVDCKKMTI